MVKEKKKLKSTVLKKNAFGQISPDIDENILNFPIKLSKECIWAFLFM